MRVLAGAYLGSYLMHEVLLTSVSGASKGMKTEVDGLKILATLPMSRTA